MIRIDGFKQHYAWGSLEAIPNFLGEATPPNNLVPVAEAWFGAHSTGSATDSAGNSLESLIAADPERFLGPEAQYSFGNELPYMLKLIAPETPLSLQVHPTRPQAQIGYLNENARHVPISSPTRTYRDSNHKPEMLFALTEFVALAGFSVRRQVYEFLEGLEGSVANRLSRRLRLATGRGLRPIVTWLLDPDNGITSEDIQQFGASCWQRVLNHTSPSPLLDEIVWNLSQTYPTDCGVIVAFLMNPLRLFPGEVLFIPSRAIHSYQSGFAIELMANSDNVIRAGLTNKHVDRELLIEVVNFEAHPPVRIAPEHPSSQIDRFYAPVEDFELSIIRVGKEPEALKGSGPRVIMALDGESTVKSRESSLTLRQGECVFVTDAEGPVAAWGDGRLAECAIP